MAYSKKDIPDGKTLFIIKWLDNGEEKEIPFLAALPMDKQLASIVVFGRAYRLYYIGSNRDAAERALEVDDVAEIKGHKITQLTFAKCGE